MSNETIPTPLASAEASKHESRLLIGKKLNHYRVTELLGRGGMGEVYVAYDETLGRRVALKSICGRYAENPDVKVRFLQEARILSRLEHPNICQIYDYLETGIGDFLVLELIRGSTLHTAIEGSASRRERIRIANEILDALIAAHKEGVVHRDLKPSNVMLSESGQVKVLDFGLATSLSDEQATLTIPRMDRDAEGWAREQTAPFTDALHGGTPGETEAGSVLGTPGYMSPEQARGQVAGPASDMYSFGLILRELLAGRRLHPPETDQVELHEKALRAEVPDLPGLPKALRKLATALASSDHQERPSAEAAQASLASYLARPRKAAVAAGIVLAMLGFLKYGYDVTHARNEAERARTASELARGQAEELATFMLDDLLGRLEPIGRTDVLEEVTSKTLLYFENLPEEIYDQSPERLARALIAVGDVRQSQGDLESALEAFERTLTLTEPLSETDSSSAGTMDQYARALGRIGIVLHRQGDLTGAEQRHRRALAIRQRLYEEDPTHQAWAAALAGARRRIGDVYFDRNELEPARQQYESALAIRRRLHEKDPEDGDAWASLSLILGSVGEILEIQGHLSAALRHFEEALAIDRQLHEEDPSHADRLWNLSHSLHFVGSVLESRRDFATARKRFEEAVLIDRQLHELDPSNADWASSLSFSLVSVGGVLTAQGELPAARERYERALAIDRDLHQKDPNNADWVTSLALSLYQLGRLELSSGDIVLGRSYLEEIVSLLRPKALQDELGLDLLNFFVCSLLELGRVDEARHYTDRLLEAEWHLDPAYGPFGELARRYDLIPPG